MCYLSNILLLLVISYSVDYILYTTTGRLVLERPARELPGTLLSSSGSLIVTAREEYPANIKQLKINGHSSSLYPSCPWLAEMTI